MPNFRSGMAARFDHPKDAAHSPRDSLRRVPTTYAAGEWSATPLTEEEAQAEFCHTVYNALGKTCERKHAVRPGLLRDRLRAVVALSRGVYVDVASRSALVAVRSTTCCTKWLFFAHRPCADRTGGLQAPGERVSAERSFRLSQGVMDGFAESKR